MAATSSQWQKNNRLYQKYIRNLIILYNNRQDVQIFTELILTLSTIIIFSLLAIRPTLITIGKLYQELGTKKETLATLDQKIENLIAARSLFEAERTRISLLNSAIPRSASPQEIIRQTEGLAKKHNLNFQSFSIEDAAIAGAQSSEQVDQDQPVYVPVTFNLSGNYLDIKAFLTDLELMRRPFYPDSIQIAIQEEEDLATGLIEITAKGSIIYLTTN